MDEKTGSSALFTDFYELTMAQGYWKSGMDRRAVFDMFFRRQPFGGGFAVFAGLGTLLEKLISFRFSPDDIAYLRSLRFFDPAFLDWLSGFRFGGRLLSLDEGTAVFPQEPLLRVEGGLVECQLIEGLILNVINFQSLIATKAARVYLAAAGAGSAGGHSLARDAQGALAGSSAGRARREPSIMEFGLRRAQGEDGALSATRAAVIGGAGGTSNTLAAKRFGVKPLGTMAHSWVMSFPSEEAAFRAYAEIYPAHPVFLIDTYDTLRSGIVNAIKVGKPLVERGGNFGVRLDSGDMYYLTVEVRRLLDEAGCTAATIACSNDLDETIISTLVTAGAPIDSWGVGTKLVTGGDDAAFTGVYKLAAFEREPGGALEPAIKFSDNPEKTTNPGVKQVWRLRDEHGMALADVLALEGEELRAGEAYTLWHPQADWRHFRCTAAGSAEPLLKPRLEAGEPVAGQEALPEIQARVRRELAALDSTYKRILNPHIYKVSITESLRGLKLALLKRCLGDL